MTVEGPCAWASLSPPLCTACAEGLAVYRPGDGSGMIECAHSFLFATPTEGHCVHCGAPFCEEIAA
jgi:hypothetical protein